MAHLHCLLNGVNALATEINKEEKKKRHVVNAAKKYIYAVGNHIL